MTASTKSVADVLSDAADGATPSGQPALVASPSSPSVSTKGFDQAQHTPGPWAWFGNAGSQSLYLATEHSGRRYVMGFKRWGMSGGQPQFQPEGRGLVDASKLLMFEVGNRSVRGVEEAKADTSVYRLDIRGIDCADARLIAAAPELLEALDWLMAALRSGTLSTTPGLYEKADAAIAKATGAA